MLPFAPAIPASGVAPPLPDYLGGAFGLGSAWTGWAAMMVPIALAGLGMATAIYMLGIALNMAHIKQWAKGEMAQVLITFILAASLVAGAALAWTVMHQTIKYIYETSNPAVAQMQKGAYYDPFAFDQAYIANTFLDCQVRLYRVMYWVNYNYKFINKLSTDVIGVDAAGAWYASAYVGVMDYMMQHLDRLFLLHYIQYRFLSIVKYTAPLLFLIGLLLRIFPLTRGAGGMLMAMGFGFFAVYPVSLALLMVVQPAPPFYCQQFAAPPMLDGSYSCGQDASDYYQANYAMQANQGTVSKMMSDLKMFIPYFYMQALFVPLVAFIITFTFFRQMGSLLGADLNEIGRGLVKLI